VGVQRPGAFGVEPGEGFSGQGPAPLRIEQDRRVEGQAGLAEQGVEIFAQILDLGRQFARRRRRRWKFDDFPPASVEGARPPGPATS